MSEGIDLFEGHSSLKTRMFRPSAASPVLTVADREVCRLAKAA